MIYQDGKLWDGWREELAKTHGKTFKLKKTVTFKTIDKFTATKKIDRRAVPVFATVQIPCEYGFTDKEDNRHTIRWAETSDVKLVGKGVNKEQLTVFHPRRIEMKGAVKVNTDQLEKYWFLINHPFCGTGKRFSKEQPPVGVGVRMAEQNLQLYGKNIVFVETNPEREKENSVEHKTLIATLKMILYKTINEKELRNIYAFYGNSDATTADENAIKLFLDDKIEGKPQNPEFSSGAREFKFILDDKARAIKGTITLAQELGVIEFVKGQRTWLMDGQPITSVAKLKDPIKTLVEYIEQNDIGEVLNLIEEAVVKAEKEAKARRKAEYA